MTYNFDPERWYDNELAALEARLDAGEIGPAEFDSSREALIKRYEEMIRRLDGTYRLPPDP